MIKVFADIETYSPTPISCGTHKYAEKAELLLWGYAVDDAPARVWDAASGKPMPADLRQVIDAARKGEAMFIWHNGMMFDTVVLEKLGYLNGVPLRAHWDTMVQAYEHGLPGSLADLGNVFGLAADQAKDKDGARLVNKFCKPAPKSHKAERYTPWNSPDDWARFVSYCRQDVEALRNIFRRLPKFNVSKVEREAQMVDAAINRRGFRIDLQLAQAAMALDAENKARLRRTTAEKTGGAVTAATQRDRLRDFIARNYGIDFEDLRKSSMERALDGDLPEPVAELLRLRLATAKTSATKYKKTVDATSSDGRLRGCLQFRGAMRTGRFAGRIFQPQNMARPAYKEAGVALGIESLKDGSASWLYEGEEAPLLSSCLRGLVIADPGKLFVVNDWSNVEGRGLAWLAGETWKLKAFRDFDEGHGHDLYKMTYGKTFGISPDDVTKPQRQMGKVLELALGYGGGAGALVTFALGFGMDLDKLADDIYGAVDSEFVKQSQESFDWFVKQNMTRGLSKRVFVALDAVKRAWRAANPNIVSFWSNLGGAVSAVLTGETQRAVTNRLAVSKSGAWLLIALPSGRKLSYAQARTEQAGMDSFTYLGVNQKTRKWERLESYSSKCVENVVQGMCCDLLTNSLVALERAGIPPVMHVHDEIVCEVPADKADQSYLTMVDVMTHPGGTYAGLPLAVDGFIDDRYKKKD